MQETKPLHYEQILFNDAVYYLEQKWNRPLTDHEKHILIEGYRFGRKTEAECELKILQTDDRMQELQKENERLEAYLNELGHNVYWRT